MTLYPPLLAPTYQYWPLFYSPSSSMQPFHRPSLHYYQYFSIHFQHVHAMFHYRCVFRTLQKLNQNSRRHKHSSGRSISKAALHFGNLCVYKPSTLCKKPSNFRHSCATNVHSEKHSKGRHHNFLMLTVIVLVQGYRHLVPIATLSSTTSGRVLPTTWSRSTNWEQYAAHHKEFGISM